MKCRWIEKEEIYDGHQLKSQFAYFRHGVLGDSVVAWQGPCHVKPEFMADGEDLLDGSEIRGAQMLHFIAEVFHESLYAGVLLQRLFASCVRDEICKLNPEKGAQLRREGDDLFFGERKLSISVAAQSPLSTVIHFALNVVNAGTPVLTCSLEDFGIEPKALALALMESFSREYQSVRIATYKVKPIH